MIKLLSYAEVKKGIETHLTYNYLSIESGRFSAFLKKLGISKGDRVFLCCDRIPELYISVVGVLKAGAILGPLFSSFGHRALKDRLLDSGAAAIIIQSSLLENVLEIRQKLPELKNIIVINGNISQSIGIEEIFTILTIIKKIMKII